MSLRARHVTRDRANALVREWHRHHRRHPGGHLFAIAAFAPSAIVGVAIVGRPVAAKTDQGSIAEVTRLVTNGHRNACSFLYGRCARAAEAMGFDSIQTFTRFDEPGTTLRAAGWVDEGLQPVKHRKGRGWQSRDREPPEDDVQKRRWRKRFAQSEASK